MNLRCKVFHPSVMDLWQTWFHLQAGPDKTLWSCLFFWPNYLRNEKVCVCVCGGRGGLVFFNSFFSTGQMLKPKRSWFCWFFFSFKACGLVFTKACLSAGPGLLLLAWYDVITCWGKLVASCTFLTKPNSQSLRRSKDCKEPGACRRQTLTALIGKVFQRNLLEKVYTIFVWAHVPPKALTQRYRKAFFFLK